MSYLIKYEYNDRVTKEFIQLEIVTTGDYITAENELKDILSDLERQGHLNVAGDIRKADWRNNESNCWAYLETYK